MSASAAPSPRRNVEFWLVSTGLVAGLVATAAFAAWPIYAAYSYLLLVVVATVLGAGVALLATLRRWSSLKIAVMTLVVYALVAVPLAVPDVLTAVETIPSGLLSVLTGPVTGWKELVTIQIPVGSYRATAIPALLVFLVGSTLAFLAAWRPDRRAALAAPVLLLMQAFGLAFGASTVAPSLAFGPFLIPAPREIALALLALALLVVLLVWHSAWSRRQALYRAREVSGVRKVGSARRAVLRRTLVATGMFLVAGVVGGVALAPVAVPPGREVLRTTIEPELHLREAVSPLSAYRLAFGDELYAQELFSVQVQGPSVDRVRIAALSDYDGAVFRVADPEKALGSSTDFRRVPTVLSGVVEGTPSRLSIEIGALGGMWVPLPEAPLRIEFEGPRRADLVDGFYYSDTLSTGIDLVGGGLSEGDRLVVETVVRETPALESLPAIPAEQRRTDPAVPESLVAWVLAQQVGLDGASLQELVDRLRLRGYLSHSLTPPTGSASWTAALSDYTFAASRSGHDADRIATLFSTLLDREDEVGPDGEAEPELLVAAVGDDEQFATAVALLGRHFGYDSRVVLGFRLDSASPVTEPAPCAAGVCRGGNLTAWAEVRGPRGEWIPVDASPQYSDALSPAISTLRDPELPTEVPSQVAESWLPPEAVPADGEGSQQSEAETATDLEWLWSALRLAGAVLLVAVLLLAPFLTIVGAKAIRRSSRRKAVDAEARIAGGWLEWIDAAVDHGRSAPRNATRTESARVLFPAQPESDTPPPALALADWADRAVFSSVPPTIEESDAFWSIVDEERRRLRAEQSFWQRVRSAVSIASFTRAVDARLLVPKPARTVLSRWNPARGATSTRFLKGVTRTRRTARPSR